MEENACRVKGKIWIACEDNTFLGYGRIILLERIKQYGSISAAARSMGMGYRHAWRLVASMNQQAPAPLVVTSTGGKGGGGARLTEEGERAVELFWEIYRDLNKFLEKEGDKLKKILGEMNPDNTAAGLNC